MGFIPNITLAFHDNGSAPNGASNPRACMYASNSVALAYVLQVFVGQNYFFVFRVVVFVFFPVLGSMPCLRSTDATYAFALSLDMPFFFWMAADASENFSYFFFPNFTGMLLGVACATIIFSDSSWAEQNSLLKFIGILYLSGHG
jgi:hypothetical protein